MRRTPLSRRRLLRDLATGAVAPFVSALAAQFARRADAASNPPAGVRRLVVIKDQLGAGHNGSMAGGPAPHRWIPRSALGTDGAPLAFSALPDHPQARGAKIVELKSAADLPKALDPLGPWWDSVLLLDRFFNPFMVGLHDNGPAGLVVRPANPNNASAVNGISIDRLIARRLSAGLPFTSVNLRQKDDPLPSGDGPGLGVSGSANPLKTYSSYFGIIGTAGVKAVAQRRSLIDLAQRQISALSASVGKDERQGLEQYLASMRQMEISFERVAATTCQPPPPPGADTNPGAYDPVKPLISHANVDLALSLLRCDLTRAVTLSFVPARGPFSFFDSVPGPFNLQGALASEKIASRTSYADLRAGLVLEGLSTGASGGNSWSLDRHDNHHAGYVNMLTAIDRWEAALVARLIEGLQAVPEDGGTMWDSTLLLWVNSGGGIHHYGMSDHPLILVGGAAAMNSTGGRSGTLRSSRYVSFPKNSRCISDAFTSVAHVCGIVTAKFGDETVAQGALPGLQF